ncbi:MAG: CopG family ribbon-helix-helix protein [Desulfobacteraceae bacterium]|nr:CopG family ribbon-helix-helix protein [Desulfobacteraceae bacterium]
MKATTVRIDDNILDRVDGLAADLSRSRSWVINQAIKQFLDYEEWFVQEVKDGLKEVENGEIATSEEAAARFRKWGANAD